MTEEKLPEGKTVGFSIQLPSATELPPATYANYVGVSHTEFEVLLDFAQMALPLSEQELASLNDTHVVVAKPVARIAIPHVLLPRVIKALEVRVKVIEREAATEAEARAADENKE